MFWPVGVSFFALVAVELALSVFVANRIGVLPTALVIVALSVLGTVLLRRQGRALASSAADSLEGRRVDGEILADRALGLLGGILLTLPGLGSGAVGSVLFIPPVRRLCRPVIMARARQWSSQSLWFSRRVGDVIDVDEAPSSHSNPVRPELG